MRILLLFLVLAGATFATSYTDCDKSCCSSNGGTWDSDYEYCDIEYGSSGYDNYINCYGNCWDDDGYSASYGYGCCAPVAMLLGLAGFAVRGS